MAGYNCSELLLEVFSCLFQFVPNEKDILVVFALILFWLRTTKVSYRSIGKFTCTNHRNWAIAPSFFLFKILFIYFQRGEGREKQKERNINVRLPPVCPQLGTWHTTQACVLTGNQTRDPLVHRLALNPLSHTSQGHSII